MWEHVVKIYDGDHKQLNAHVVAGKKPTNEEVNEILSIYENGDYAVIETRIKKI